MPPPHTQALGQLKWRLEKALREKDQLEALLADNEEELREKQRNIERLTEVQRKLREQMREQQVRIARGVGTSSLGERRWSFPP